MHYSCLRSANQAPVDLLSGSSKSVVHLGCSGKSQKPHFSENIPVPLLSGMNVSCMNDSCIHGRDGRIVKDF